MINLKKTGYAFINILIYILGTEILTYIIGKFKFFQNIWFLNFYLLIAPIIIVLVLIKINKDLFKSKWQDFKDNQKNYISLAIKYYICGLILMLMASMLVSFFSKGLPENEEGNRELLKLLPIYSIISMVIIAPLSEEISFRGSFKGTTKNKNIYLIITSFLFGFMHVAFNGDFLNFLPYSALGFFLGKAYYETENIFVSTFMHSFHNLFCILLLFLGGSI